MLLCANLRVCGSDVGIMPEATGGSFIRPAEVILACPGSTEGSAVISHRAECMSIGRRSHRDGSLGIVEPMANPSRCFAKKASHSSIYTSAYHKFLELDRNSPFSTVSCLSRAT